ncbi:hypothetical protein INT47_011310 [Mucor saturninus]|uniref:Uncharacterized protein n=1 Tax=Mucor saturninus TaxID=64648 RepID=A0A8H7RL56_9FUNG|nr:hypothetical protein INT47_011310 [Mucor saturninus]
MNKSSHLLTSIPTNIITEDSPSILLHRLHTNERQLRTLAVVLSLAGGLALSFALGVGIMIYWYLHKCKQKRRLGDRNTDNHEQDEEDSDDGKSLYSICNYRNCDFYNRDNPNHPTAEEEQVQEEIILLDNLTTLPLPPISLVSTPEPSAPSAKELHIHTHTNATSSSAHEDLCHDCLLPPPAYTKN